MAFEPNRDGETLTVQIPLRLRKRGGRKLVVVPEGAAASAPRRTRVDGAMMKAIARAHRWREVLENSTHATIAEIAATEELNASYVGRVLRMTLLAPEVVEAILDGRQSEQMTLAALMRPFPVIWQQQMQELSR